MIGLLDPQVLAVPYLSNGVAVQSFVEGLLKWKALKDDSQIEVLTSNNLVSDLTAAQVLPNWADVHYRLRSFDIPVDVKDMVTIYDALLSRTPTIEERLGIRELLFEEADLSTDFFASRPDPLPAAFLRVSVLALLLLRNGSAGRDIRLLTTSAPECPYTFEASARVEAIEALDGTVTEEVVQVADRLTAVCCTVSFAGSEDVGSLWEGASRAVELEESLQIGIARSQRMALESVPHFRIGKAFADRVLEGRFNVGSLGRKLFRACQQTLLGEDLQATHSLRTGAGPNDRQRQRGVDRAWRRDVDRDCHLHYWQSRRS